MQGDLEGRREGIHLEVGEDVAELRELGTGLLQGGILRDELDGLHLGQAHQLLTRQLQIHGVAVLEQVDHQLHALLDARKGHLHVVCDQTEQPEDVERQADHGRREAGEDRCPTKSRHCFPERVGHAPLPSPAESYTRRP